MHNGTHSNALPSNEGIEGNDYRGIRSLHPLPPVLHHGLSVIAFFSFASFLSSVSLFSFLCWRLWTWGRRSTQSYNQFIVLIMNLLFADIQQSLAFLLSLQWVVQDGIYVKTNSCRAQGWLVGSGDLASGIWCLAIGLHTASSVLFNMRPKKLPFYLMIVGVWLFVYACNVVGLALHPNLYVRAGAWCWINERYPLLRLYTHYLWIFMAELGVVVIYSASFIIISHRIRNGWYKSDAGAAKRAREVAKLMAVYPAVYVICTLPLAAGRTAAMAGRDVPIVYLAFAGAMITSNGWIDCALYAFTRRVILFSETPPSDDECGLDTFSVPWLCSGNSSGFGTVTTITGGAETQKDQGLTRHASKGSTWSFKWGAKDKLMFNLRRQRSSSSQASHLSKTSWRSSFSSTLGELRTFTSGNIGGFSGHTSLPSDHPDRLSRLPFSEDQQKQQIKPPAGRRSRSLSLTSLRQSRLSRPHSRKLSFGRQSTDKEAEEHSIPGELPAHAEDSRWYVTQSSALGGNVHIPISMPTRSSSLPSHRKEAMPPPPPPKSPNLPQPTLAPKRPGPQQDLWERRRLSAAARRKSLIEVEVRAIEEERKKDAAERRRRRGGIVQMRPLSLILDEEEGNVRSIRG